MLRATMWRLFLASRYPSRPIKLPHRHRVLKGVRLIRRTTATPTQVGQYFRCTYSKLISRDRFTASTLALFEQPGKWNDCVRIQTSKTNELMNIPRFDTARVLTIGDAMLDRYWLGETTRISAEAPIPVVGVYTTEDRPGGAANVALNVAALGSASSLIAVTGVDEMGEVLKDKLESSGIACDFLQIDGWPTITKVRMVSRNQQMLRADFEQSLEAHADYIACLLYTSDAADE